MQIISRTIQSVQRGATFVGQKLSEIDRRIVKAAAFVFAAVVLVWAYKRIISPYLVQVNAEVDQINRDRQQQADARRNALIAKRDALIEQRDAIPVREDAVAKREALLAQIERLYTLIKEGLPDVVQLSKDAILTHLNPVKVGENDYVRTIGDDKKEGLRIPRHISSVFNHGETWMYGTLKPTEPLRIYEWLCKDLGEEKAQRCLNICAFTAWEPTLGPISEQVDLNTVNVQEKNLITVEKHIFKVITVMQFFHKNGGERFSHLVRTVELDVRDLDREDGTVPSLKVAVRYPNQK